MSWPFWDILQEVPHFHLAKSAIFVNIRSERNNSTLPKSHVLRINTFNGLSKDVHINVFNVFNVLTLKHCWWYNIYFLAVYWSNLKHWATKWRTLKRHDWQNKCLGTRHLSQFDFFEQTFDWQSMSLFSNAPITYSIMFSNVSQEIWCVILIFDLIWQVRIWSRNLLRLSV